MAKSSALTELSGGVSSFTLVGKAKIREGAFSGVTQKEGSLWRQVNSSFGVDTGEGNVVYGRIWGGFMTDKQSFMARKAEDGKFFDVKWSERLNEEVVESINTYELYKAGLETGADGKLIIKEFAHAIDFENYLAEHLKDDTDVRVRGDVNYNEYNGNINRQYNVKTVYLNTPYEKDGETKQSPAVAQMRQTLLINDDALDRKWERELEKDGETLVTVFAPQYVGNMTVDGKKVKIGRQVAFPQVIKVKVDKEDEKAIELRKSVIKRYFAVKKGTVREVQSYLDINEGYQEAQGVELNDEMLELIEMGMLTEEDVKKQMTIRGNRVSELVFSKPVIKPDESGKPTLVLEDKKYAPEALFPPILDGEDDVDSMFSEDEDEGTEAISDDAFAELFN